jgi:hypothetical protein
MDRAAFQSLQAEMPFTEELWSEAFRQDPRSYSRLQHCLTNIAAKLGAVLQRIELSDHYGPDYKLGLNREKDGMALAFIIMSAMKAANSYPGGAIDLSALIEADLQRRSDHPSTTR